MMKYGICTLSIIPVRKEAAHRSEMVTQLLFGETYHVLAQSDDKEWIQIRMEYDQYEGWIPFGMYASIEENEMYAHSNTSPVVIQNPTTVISCNSQPILCSVGSLLPQLSSYIIHYEAEGSPQIETVSIVETAKKYLNTPYLWGGRSIFGIDCSGFTQKIFQIHQFTLPRDAYQQAEIGQDVGLEDLRAGDLAFFHNEKNRITHVGMMLNEKEIIHASHYVRVDYIDKNGIFNYQTNERTHELSHFKRVL